ncbi:class II aldolase/adducin family protein [Ferrimonas balearica DSM 9799]|uniref:3-oxo-tetronate 4-phosphate decarboxylase n=1 Tax=Ferrimonas balearica (strain DSM 9799 / CCM 4581 / KCTC 23876 / PAT) TaxID=550540 RepID=E1SL69_FERBD|nr:aldolase [Ferrimonas balearica]ADN75447.1 class II aldolase/adducin family protein [Ferrimonas balearica DSM 9799]
MNLAALHQQEQALRQQMVELGRSLFARGYATGGAGNLSVKLADSTILATPTGASLGRLQADTLSKVSLEGEHLSGDRPSKEVQFHLAMYRANPDFGAVVHLHCTHLTALSCRADLNPDNVIRPFTPYYVMRVGKLPLVPYYAPGASEIARDLAALSADHRAMLLANHGPVVTGTSLINAVDNMEELEETAKLMLMLENQPIRYLTEDQISELERRYG